MTWNPKILGKRLPRKLKKRVNTHFALARLFYEHNVTTVDRWASTEEMERFAQQTKHLRDSWIVIPMH